MGIEPARLTAVCCPNAAHRTAASWKQQLEPFTALECAVSEAAQGSAQAVAAVAATRREHAATPALAHGLDVFHTTREAKRILVRHWRRAAAKGEQAEAAAETVAAAQRQGIAARGGAQAARAAGAKAIAAFEQAERRAAAWDRAPSGWDLFGPDGRLHDRLRAESESTAALWDLNGPDWPQVRTFWSDPRSLAFLDRMHRRWERAEPRPDGRAALAWRWWLHHRRPKPADPLTESIRAVGREGTLNTEDQASYNRVAAVLWDTFRASSAVEGMNRVLRIQQSRHRRMTQPMLDLKRLYWNCHPFRSGPRQDLCPYQALGLTLPTYDFWELLHTDPDRLTQELSTQGNTE